MALIASYSFNGQGLIATDYSGNGHTIAMANSGQRSPDAYHGVGAATAGLVVAGGTSGNSIATFNTAPDRSITFWAYSGTGLWAVRYVNASNLGTFGLYYTGGTLRVRANDSYDTYAPPQPGWHHYGIIHDTSALELSFYVDGVLDATISTSGNLEDAVALDLDSNSSGWRIDDFRVYSHAISGVQVVADMNTPVQPVSSGWYDSSGSEKEVFIFDGTNLQPVGTTIA